jgi:Trk-type K+ transport system membrane component
LKKKIITIILYIIIGIGFFLFSTTIQIIELIFPSDKYKENYINDHINFVILTLTFLTIFLRIICIFFMKNYSEILGKKDDFYRGEQHDQFIQDLENKMDNSNTNWSMRKNNEQSINLRTKPIKDTIKEEDEIDNNSELSG